MGRRPDRRLGRRTARLKAVQALYQIAMTGIPAETAIVEFVAHRLAEPIDGQTLPEPDSKFFAELVRGAAAEHSDLDSMIAAVLKEDWTVERLEATLGAILRAGVWELSTRQDIPPRATISEYTDIAGAFMGERETSLVNGVLNSIAAELRPDEMAKAVLADALPEEIAADGGARNDAASSSSGNDSLDAGR
ncbi:MAG: transcription antitermination factor NusB [Dongiaceae bacterium]